MAFRYTSSPFDDMERKYAPARAGQQTAVSSSATAPFGASSVVASAADSPAVEVSDRPTRNETSTPVEQSDHGSKREPPPCANGPTLPAGRVLRWPCQP